MIDENSFGSDLSKIEIVEDENGDFQQVKKRKAVKISVESKEGDLLSLAGAHLEKKKVKESDNSKIEASNEKITIILNDLQKTELRDTKTHDENSISFDSLSPSPPKIWMNKLKYYPSDKDKVSNFISFRELLDENLLKKGNVFFD